MSSCIVATAMPRPTTVGAIQKAQLKEERRNKVVKAYLESDKARGWVPKISKNLGVPESTIRSIVAKYESTGSVVAIKQSGRPPLMTKRYYFSICFG